MSYEKKKTLNNIIAERIDTILSKYKVNEPNLLHAEIRELFIELQRICPDYYKLDFVKTIEYNVLKARLNAKKAVQVNFPKYSGKTNRELNEVTEYISIAEEYVTFLEKELKFLKREDVKGDS